MLKFKTPQIALLGLVLLSSIYLFQSCEKDDSDSNNEDYATVNVFLTDGPGNYQQVNVDVDSVFVHSDQTGWVKLSNINSGIYNLLDFTNGADTLLGSAQLPSGSISQMRLVLGENNTVMEDSVLHDLKTPSGQQSGIKFNIHQSLTNGITYDVWIDFDAGKSVVKTGNSKYLLKPVVRAFTKATSGAITGIALPDSADSYVYVVNSGDTFSSNADTTGYYLIQGVPASTYDVHFDNDNGWKDTVISSVVVTDGSVTDMDTTTMSK
jgi:hypothetical protein